MEGVPSGRISLEKPVVIACPLPDGGSLALDGLFRAGASPDAPGVLIAAPHPLYGGSMESPVVTQVGLAAASVGLASLRFDWRGVGASSGTASGEAADLDADYAAALHHLAETVPGPLCAAGYSMGAAAAARVAHGEPRVTALLLVAPPPSMLDDAKLAAFRGRVLVVTGDRDRIAPAAELRARVEALPAARFACLPEVDHFFGTGLSELGRVVETWLAEMEPEPL